MGAMQLAVAQAGEAKADRDVRNARNGYDPLGATRFMRPERPAQPSGDDDEEPDKEEDLSTLESLWNALLDAIACRPECSSAKCRRTLIGDDDEDVRDRAIAMSDLPILSELTGAPSKPS